MVWFKFWVYLGRKMQIELEMLLECKWIEYSVEFGSWKTIFGHISSGRTQTSINVDNKLSLR